MNGSKSPGMEFRRSALPTSRLGFQSTLAGISRSRATRSTDGDMRPRILAENNLAQPLHMSSYTLLVIELIKKLLVQNF